MTANIENKAYNKKSPAAPKAGTLRRGTPDRTRVNVVP